MSRKDVMLAYPYDEGRLLNWKYAFVQPKLDGMRCRAVITDRGVQLFSSQGNPIKSVPHITKELQLLCETDPVVLDGELYTHGLSFQKIVSITKRTKNLHPDYCLVDFVAFDIIDEEPQDTRLGDLDLLMTWLDQPHIKQVPYAMITGPDQLAPHLAEYIAEGYEGVILRHPWAHYEPKRSTNLMKLKPQHIDMYPVVGYLEEYSIHGEPKNRLGALTCFKDNQYFSVGTGPALTDEWRNRLWANRDKLPGSWAVVKYQDLTDDRQVPRHPVLMEVHMNAAS